MPQWPAELDALVAAPRHHRVLFENDRVRVLDTRIPPGGTVPVHTHRWPSVWCVLSMADFVRRDGDGAVVVDTRTLDPPVEVPPAMWSEPLPPHSLENVGAAQIHVISVELKDELRGAALERRRPER